MNFHKSRLWGGMILALLIVVAMPGNIQGAVRVGGTALTANGQLAQGFQYTGSCPVNLKFDFGLISTEATTVTYSFTRNDGPSGGSRTANLPRAGEIALALAALCRRKAARASDVQGLDRDSLQHQSSDQ